MNKITIFTCIALLAFTLTACASNNADLTENSENGFSSERSSSYMEEKVTADTSELTSSREEAPEESEAASSKLPETEEEPSVQPPPANQIIPTPVTPSTGDATNEQSQAAVSSPAVTVVCHYDYGKSTKKTFTDEQTVSKINSYFWLSC